MRKLILMLFAIIPVVGFSQVKNAGCFLRLEKPYQSDTLSMENDSVKISFRFNSLNYFCELSIENKTNEVVLVDWDKFLMVMEGESLPVLFEDTQMINKDGSKGQTPIAPETKLVRSVAPIDYIDLDMSLYNKGWIKKRGDQEIGFMIPVVFGDQTKNYHCSISVSLK